MPFIMDASALLAVVLKEPGAYVVLEALKSGAHISAVNVAEVASRLRQEGWTAFQVNAVFQELPVQVLPIDLDAAMLTGRYRAPTDELGLSLGGRACLATAYLQAATALTADRAWGNWICRAWSSNAYVEQLPGIVAELQRKTHRDAGRA